MIFWSLRAAGVILLGAFLTLMLRRRSAATRSLVLRATLVAAWALPLLVLVAPRVALPLPRLPAVAPRNAPSPVGKKVATPMPMGAGGSVIQPVPGDASSLGFVRQTPFSTGRVLAVPVLLLAWGLGTGLLVLRWAFAFGRLRWVARAGEEAEGKVRLAEVPVPLTYGRTILLPREARKWPEARLRAAILHEQAHVLRGDWAWQTVAALFCALHWPNPAAWLLLRLLRDAAEVAADDEALREMAPSDYARELLAVAASSRGTGPALAMARRGGVGDRVVAALSTDRDRRGSSRTVAAVSFAALLACGLGIAGVTLASRAAATGTRRGASSSKAALPGGGSLRLVAVRDLSTASARMWSPAGGSLPQADEALLLRTFLLLPQGFPPPQAGKRRLQFLFATTEPKADPTQFTLSVVDGEVLQPVGSAVQAVKGGGTALALYCDVPNDLDPVDLEGRLPAGPWRQEPAAWPTMAEAHEDAEVQGRRVPVWHVEARPAGFSADRSYRIVVKDVKGRTLEEAYDTGFGEGQVDGLVPKGTPFGRLAVESRELARVEFSGVRLRPGTSASLARLASGHSVELAGVWSPDGLGKPWSPDGSRGDLDGVGNYDGTVPTGMRAVLFALRVRDSSARVPTVQVRPSLPGANFAASSLSLLRDEGKSLLVWVRTLVPKDLEETSLDVDLKLQSDEVGAPLPLGKEPGQTTVEVTNVDVRPGVSYAQLGVTPRVPMDPARFWYGVSPVDVRGGSPEAFSYEEPGPTFRISMAHPERAVAWRLWRSPRERTRFEGVRLRPNP